MSEIEISAKKKIGDDLREATIYYDFGESLEEALDKFDEKVIFSNFRANAKITAQAAIRRYMESGKSAEEIAKIMAGWKPGVALERVSDPIAAFKAKFAAMNPEEQAKALEDLRASLKS